MPQRSIFSEAHRAFMHQAYMRQHLQPAAVTSALNAQFKSAFTLKQVQRYINAQWSAKRKAVAARYAALAEPTVEALAKKQAAGTAVVLERWSKKSEALVEKTLDMALQARDPRTVGTLTAAASSATRMWRLNAGLDGPGESRGGGTTYNYAFVQVEAPRVPKDVEAAPAE